MVVADALVVYKSGQIEAIVEQTQATTKWPACSANERYYSRRCSVQGEITANHYAMTVMSVGSSSTGDSKL